ncbi:Ankyrin-3 [Dactylellina cionopaga]|nr:Ankyrin-3 [Dactylellina cionopaga]
MAFALPSESIVGMIERVTAKFDLCQNRVWEVARSLDPEKREKLLEIPYSVRVTQAGSHKGHDQCTFDFCEHSRLDFTGVSQRHECSDGKCTTKYFDTTTLEKALIAGKLSAWALDGSGMVERPKSFMAISHVWSDGTGSGAWPPGQVNQCLFDFFKKIAEKFECDGIWWDTVCIPMGKAARSKAIINMERNYEDARITLVHDSFLRNWEWIDAEIACFAITMSPWFSRGWTALELARSRKVKILFKGGVIKDLDEDILAKVEWNPPLRHQIVSQVIEGLRTKRVVEVNQLLRVLGPRHTSWPRDVAIISGQLVGVTIKRGATQQAIYQSVLRKIGKISHENLFHNSVTMSKEFIWCPTNVFNFPLSSTLPALAVTKNGDVEGEWDIFPGNVLDQDQKRYNWKDTHPLVEAKLRASLQHGDKHLLLVNPKDKLISMALLVRSIDSKGGSKIVQFVGPTHFHPPLARQHFKQKPDRGAVTIVGAVEGKVAKRAETISDVDFLSACADGDVETIEAVLSQHPEPTAVDEDGNTGLHLAGKYGHSDAVDLLIRHLSPLYTNQFDQTVLHLAAQNGHENVVELLVQHDVSDIDGEDMDTWTPVHYAAWKCFEGVIEIMLDSPNFRSQDIRIQDQLGQTALHLAAERGNIQIVKALLKKGADISIECKKLQTILHRAAWGGSKAVMMELLSQKSTSYRIRNWVDKDGKTALHIASEKGHNQLVELLLGCGAAMDIQDSMEQTPLHLAAQNGHIAVATQLMEYTELELEDKNGLTPLLLAIKSGHTDMVGELLGAGSKLESRSGSGRTPLMWAAEGGHRDVVQLLVNKGANVMSADSDGQTPLLVAAEKGHNQVVEILLEEAVDLEFKVTGGRTPLLWAAEKGHEEVVRVLLNLGANTDTTDAKGQVPLTVAARYGHEAAVKLLLDHPGIHLELADDDGKTALSWAASGGHMATVTALLDHGAYIEHRDNNSRTPLALASSMPVMNILLERGASLANVNSGNSTIVRSNKMLLDAIWKGQERTAILLIDGGADLESRDFDQKTPLALATYHNQPGLVKMLLDKGANVEARDKDNATPLWLATENQDDDIVAALLQAGAMPLYPEHGGRILLRALEKSNRDIAKLVLERGADANYKGSLETPLEYATRNGDVEMMELLFSEGARVTATGDGDECRPMHAALHARVFPGDAVELLFENGLSIPSNEWTKGWILELAAKNGHRPLLRRLLQAGAKVDHTGVDNRTPLSWAAEVGAANITSIMKDLLDYGANIEAADYTGQTPLFFAVGNIKSVKFLLSYDANPEARDIYGRTPLSRAVAHGYKEVVKLLSGNSRVS